MQVTYNLGPCKSLITTMEVLYHNNKHAEAFVSFRKLFPTLPPRVYEALVDGSYSTINTDVIVSVEVISFAPHSK